MTHPTSDFRFTRRPCERLCRFAGGGAFATKAILKGFCSSVFLRASSLAALSLVLLSACGRPAVTTAPALTDEQLANAEYNSPTPAQGPIRLSDGVYRETVVDGSASEVTISLLPDLSAYGDLDGDGVADGAAVLAGSGGGSGTFISLVALRNEEGSPQHVATAYLGDRVQVTSLTIDSGELLVTLVSHAPTDPLCCPTLEATRRFRLRQESLEERKEEG